MFSYFAGFATGIPLDCCKGSLRRRPLASAAKVRTLGRSSPDILGPVLTHPRPPERSQLAAGEEAAECKNALADSPRAMRAIPREHFPDSG
jgi:hypothetical protein